MAMEMAEELRQF